MVDVSWIMISKHLKEEGRKSGREPAFLGSLLSVPPCASCSLAAKCRLKELSNSPKRTKLVNGGALIGNQIFPTPEHGAVCPVRKLASERGNDRV